MKIAIVRGKNMNPYEMQTYGPIASKHEVTGYAAYNNAFELNGIRFPVKRLHMIDEYYGALPSPARNLVNGLLLPSGMNARMFGLEKELEGTDIIHAAETSNGYSYQAARVRRERNKRLVLTVWENIPFLSIRQFQGFDHIPLVGETLRKGLTDNERIVRYVKDNTDIFIAVTGRAKAALMTEGVPSEKIRVVPVGIDTERFKPAVADPSIRRSLGISDGDFMVLYIGRLVREKGIYDLLYAARLLSMDKRLEHVRIVMAGEGPEKKNVETMIRKLGLDTRVVLAGGFPYGQVPALYNAADTFILPSIPMPFWQEQFGMVLAEAMASGLPVVSTLSGSIPEVVGDGGILVQPNDPVSLCREIEKLALDNAYCKKVGLSARKHAESEFDIGRVSQAITAVYEELARQ